MYTAFQQYDSSLYCYDKALPIFEAYQKNEEIAWTKLLQAVNYYYLGENEIGQQLLEEPFWKLQSLSKDIHSVLYNLRGIFYRETGDLSQLITATENALSIELERKPPVDSSYVATLYNNLGIAHENRGDFKRASDYFLKALNLFQQLPNEVDKQIILGENIGRILLKQKKDKAAIPYFKKNTVLLNQNPQLPSYKNDLTDQFHNLARAYLETSQYDSMYYYLDKAIALDAEDKVAINYYHLGRYYKSKGKLELALQNLEQSLQYALQTNKVASNLDLHRIYYRMGNIYALQNDSHTALQYYQKALVDIKPAFTDSLNIYQNPSLEGNVLDDIHFLETLHEKARTLFLRSKQEKDLTASLSTYLLAIEWIDHLKQSYVLEDNGLFWGERFKTIFSEAIHTAYLLSEITKAPEYIETALILSEKSKANLLLEAFATKTGIANTIVPNELLDKERSLGIDIAFYERSYYNAKQKQDTAKVKRFEIYLRDLRIELASLKEKMVNDYPDYFRLKYEKQTINIRQSQQTLLDKQTALVEYFIGEEHAYAFLLRKDDLQMFTLPPSDSINHYLEEFTPSLLGIHAFMDNPTQSYRKFNTSAFRLYKHLLQEGIQKIPADINKLIIIPDEGLSTLPFEVLNTELHEKVSSNFEQLPYLIKRYQIHYGYSIKLLEKNLERHGQLKPNTRCLAFAPTYNSGGTVIAALDVRKNQLRNGITALKNSANEIKAVNKYFDGLFIASAEASKANFIDRVQDYGILHLAMHGEADFENRKFGHLIFSNADTNSLSHNLLYNYEIANLDLNAQLAVLSACETGVGKYESGEGVFSIARSFMYAGVPSLVMSLWKVNDQSTSQIMPLFYQNLSRGMEKSRALQEAKLEYLETAELAYRHPFYWASFVALGDPKPLRLPSLFGNIFICLSFVSILGIGAYVLFKKRGRFNSLNSKRGGQEFL